jgi:hypothetical protein
MGAVSGSITQSGTTATSSGGATQLTSDEIEKTKIEAIAYDTALSSVNRVAFTVPSPGGSFNFKLKAPTLPNAKWFHLGSVATLNFLGQSTPFTVTFSTQPASIDEGSEGTFEITTTGLEKGSSLQWSLVHVGTISKAYHYDASSSYGLSGSVTLDNSSSPKGTFKIKPLADNVTNPTGFQKQFKIEIKRNGIVAATSNTITVNESDSILNSKGPVYTLTLSPTTVDEGGSVTANITTQNPISAGQTLNWALVDIPAKYVTSASTYFDTAGSVSLDSAGNGSFKINVKEDNLDNPVAKTFKVMLYNTSGFAVLTSAVGPVSVNDTSKSPGLSSALGAGLAGGDLAGRIFSSQPAVSGQDAGVSLALNPDGSWIAYSSTTGATAPVVTSGKWFDPITKGIGNSFYVKITGTPITQLGDGRFYSNATGWVPVTQYPAVGVAAHAYRCVDPATAVLIDETGVTKLAGQLAVGDSVYTMHEHTKLWNYYKITYYEQTEKPKFLVTFTDNTTLTASHSHKVYMGRDIWMQLFDLKPGDCVVSHSGMPKEILSIQDIGLGTVISMEIENAHTYIANDIISHNVKTPTPYTWYSEYQIQYKIEFSSNPTGTGTTSTIYVTLGGTVPTPPEPPPTYYAEFNYDAY